MTETKITTAPIVIAGPTASGKSALALRLARLFRDERGQAVEIVCADSVTVFRGFDIGSAKPTKEEQREFRHHLIDVAGAEESFTGGDFIRLAIPAILGIQARKALPLLVGGTGFYLRALLRGMASDEAEDPVLAAAIKERLVARAAAEGYEALHKEVLRLDPGSAATVHANDHYRVVRALQAMEIYKKPWSELNRTARQAPWRFPGTRFFCLEVDKELLKERIRQRTSQLLEAGLMSEVRGLLASGLSPASKALLSVGYKECLDTLEGREPESTLAERITLATNRLAKQQRTWFKSEQGVEMLRGPEYWEELSERLETAL